MEGPTSHVYFSQRLRLHYVDWGNTDAPPLLLVHGGRDHCRNWDWVAEALRDRYHIIAPDLRGHGDSQWMIGGSYNHVDYVYDIAQLISQKRMQPVTIIGHSMGGAVSLTYSGLFPNTVKKLIVIEGLGAPPEIIKQRLETSAKDQLLYWVKELRKNSGRLPKRYKSLEDAYERMQTENPHLTETQARHLTIHGSNQNEDGTFSWKFDNYVRTISPIGINFENQIQLYQQITCPTLLIKGMESWASDPDETGQTKYFQDVETANIEKAGHWVHHDQLEVFLKLTEDFLAK